MFNKIISATISGIDGIVCNVEVDFSNGMPFFNMVGLLSSEIKESKERIRISIKNSGYEILSKKITVNISPANIRKSGTSLDLPIAVGILSNTGILTRYINDKICIIGELSLNGNVVPVKGIISMIESAKKFGCTHIILPKDNLIEASIINGVSLTGVNSLKDTIEKLNNHNLPDEHNFNKYFKKIVYPDLGNLSNQPLGIRSALICASGNHNMIIAGEQGIGKSMICNSIMGILPKLSNDEAMEVTKIYSIAGLNTNNKIIYNRPLRTPHSSISISSLIGGGTYPKPGEISLAHNGILYLDELPLFKNNVLQSLRVPLEDKKITITRSNHKYTFPANNLLLASMNLCPCGAYPNKDNCKCSDVEIKNYKKKISGAFLDRIDIVCNLKRPENTLVDNKTSSKRLSVVVQKAREIQLYRNKILNSSLNSSNFQNKILIEENIKSKLDNIFNLLKLSMRGYMRVLKIARTIADIEGSENITMTHLDEAIFFERNRGFNE